MKTTKTELTNLKDQLFNVCVELSETRNELVKHILTQKIDRLTRLISSVELIEEEPEYNLDFIDCLFFNVQMDEVQTEEEIFFESELKRAEYVEDKGEYIKLYFIDNQSGDYTIMKTFVEKDKRLFGTYYLRNEE